MIHTQQNVYVNLEVTEKHAESPVEGVHMAATASLTALAQRIPSATLRLGSADVTQAG